MNEMDWDIEHLRFMEVAIDLAKQAGKAGEIPVGAVVVRDGKILGSGMNARECGRDPTLHAEIVALRNTALLLGNWRLDNCSLYVTLEPCPMCAGALVQARIPQLFFGCEDPKAGACGTLYDIPRDSRLNHRILVRKGILREECARILRDFFQARRR